MANNGSEMVLCLPIRKYYLASVCRINDIIFSYLVDVTYIIILMKSNIDGTSNGTISVCSESLHQMIEFYSSDAFLLLCELRLCTET